jgi:glycosyltransferase involved in cell wall biosynthesis
MARARGLTLRIGIDAHIVGAGKGGVERFLREVCALLPVLGPGHRYIVFCSAAALAAGEFGIPLPHVELVALPFSNPLIERALVLPWLARRHRLDVLLVQRLAPWAMGGCRVVLTVHDITPIKFPRQYRGLTNALVRLLTASSVRRSAHVLTPCLTIAREVAAHCGEAPGKFSAYFNGVDAALFRPLRDRAEGVAIIERLGLRTPYVLTSGALEPRKNIETMIRMLPRIPMALCAELVVAGGSRDPGYAAELSALAAMPAHAGRVRFLGYVSDRDLADLYRAAAAFLSASRDEGFNMPVLEAMASGIPTVCSDIDVHRELFAGVSAFFPADDPGALAEAVSGVLSDIASTREAALKGLARARQLNWTAAVGRVGMSLWSNPGQGVAGEN